MASPGDLINITQDVGATAYGVPTRQQAYIGVIMFIAILLIWVGSSLIAGYLFTNYGSERTAFGAGGTVALVGCGLIISAKVYDHFK
jgi:hypothetical protein